MGAHTKDSMQNNAESFQHNQDDDKHGHKLSRLAEIEKEECKQKGSHDGEYPVIQCHMQKSAFVHTFSRPT